MISASRMMCALRAYSGRFSCGESSDFFHLIRLASLPPCVKGAGSRRLIGGLFLHGKRSDRCPSSEEGRRCRAFRVSIRTVRYKSTRPCEGGWRAKPVGRVVPSPQDNACAQLNPLRIHFLKKPNKKDPPCLRCGRSFCLSVNTRASVRSGRGTRRPAPGE